MSTPEQIVDDFVAAINNQDLGAALELVADDCTYDNVPIGVTRGREPMREVLTHMFAGGPVTFVTTRQVAVGNTVMNERTDTFTWGGQVVLPVAGVFEVNDGRITLWRDYFDMKMMAPTTTE